MLTLFAYYFMPTWLHSLFICLIQNNAALRHILILYKALNDLAPVYLTSLLSRYNPTRSSQISGLLVVPRIVKSTKGGRTFQICLPNSGIAFL